MLTHNTESYKRGHTAASQFKFKFPEHYSLQDKVNYLDGYIAHLRDYRAITLYSINGQSNIVLNKPLIVAPSTGNRNYSIARYRVLVEKAKQTCLDTPLHISELVSVNTPVCLRYEPNYTDPYHKYMVLVGKKWYNDNKALARLLDKKPNPPFNIIVTPTGDTTERGHPIYKAIITDL